MALAGTGNEKIGGEGDIPARSLHRVGDDLAVQQNDDCGSMLTLPPPPAPFRTDALIVLSVSWTIPLGVVEMLIAPPLAWSASVVTEL